MQANTNLIWIDMEMTGLDPITDKVLEIATIATDKDLNILAEGPVLAIHQPDSILAAMSEWCQTHHNASGLTARVKASTITERDAELQTLAFIRDFVPAGVSPLCGNSVGQDRRFIQAYMPELCGYFHYRNLDVSSVKILWHLWRPEQGPFMKKECHLALDDIRESIAELAFYRKNFFKDND